MLPHKKTRNLDNSFVVDRTVSNIEFPGEESYRSWLETQNEIVEWNSGHLRNAPCPDQKQIGTDAGVNSKKGRPRKFEWTEEFNCSFGGTPRVDSKKKLSALPPSLPEKWVAWPK